MPEINGVFYVALPLQIPATNIGGNLYNRGMLLAGFTFAETTGAAPAACRLLDGNDANGIDAIEITLLANESVQEFIPDSDLYFRNGPFLLVTAGTVRGTLWYVDVTQAELQGANFGRNANRVPSLEPTT